MTVFFHKIEHLIPLDYLNRFLSNRIPDARRTKRVRKLLAACSDIPLDTANFSNEELKAALGFVCSPSTISCTVCSRIRNRGNVFDIN
jgi:hypothetical protein